MKRFSFEMYPIHFVDNCRLLATVLKLNLCVILIELLKILQEVGLEGARPMVKFEEAQNILNVLLRYEILGFCRSGFDPKNICEPKLAKKRQG